MLNNRFPENIFICPLWNFHLYFARIWIWYLLILNLFTLSQSTFIIFPNCRVLLHLKVLLKNYCSEYSIQYTFSFCWLIMKVILFLHLVLCNATYYSVLFYRKLCLVRYDAFLKFLILLSPFSIFVYSNLERFYQPVFSYFVTAILLFTSQEQFYVFKCLWFYSKLFFFLPWCKCSSSLWFYL